MESISQLDVAERFEKTPRCAFFEQSWPHCVLGVRSDEDDGYPELTALQLAVKLWA